MRGKKDRTEGSLAEGVFEVKLEIFQERKKYRNLITGKVTNTQI
jgi:hypothetical protein